jgi:signal transduction histidine kinase
VSTFRASADAAAPPSQDNPPRAEARMTIPERLYARFGPRVFWSVLIVPVLATVPLAATIVVIADRYLGLKFADWAPVLWIGYPAVSVIGAAGLLMSRREWQTVMAWAGQGRTTGRAPETLAALLRARRLLTRAMLIALPGLPPLVIWVILSGHKPLWAAAPLAVVALVAILSLWSVVVPLSELIVRPMVEDVAAHLPADYEGPRGQRLRAKTLAPLPVVALMAALIEGAFANLTHAGGVRLSIALMVGVGAVGFATLIFLLNAQSLISPVDHLMAATKRVRDGDLETPVPVVSSDELGELSQSFNRMLRGLRERQSLLEHNAELTAALEGSLARIVTAADAERRRVERDLHDGAQQHLVLLGLKLGLLERRAAADRELAALVHETRRDLERALTELRDLAHGIYPAALEHDGLAAALRDAAGRATIPARVESNGTGRYPPEIEAAVYFCCLEALQNASKHAGSGAQVTISLHQRGEELQFAVADDGEGFDPGVASGSGLQNMADRIGALGGTVSIRSASGEGTTVTGAVSIATARRVARVS